MNFKHHISFIKGITWRMVATTDTITLSYIYTGHIGNSLKIGFIEIFTKIFLFYLHERLWLKIKWGTKIRSIVSEENKPCLDDTTRNELELQEEKYRSFIKGVSWRIFGTIDTIIIATFITGDYSKALQIGATEFITKIILYYFHERTWMYFIDKSSTSKH
ncbi:MAG: DUF2061 domain-containing protein [Chitinophagales bacterium]|nr:DUF2061 domain-containing protein [Bacteroidota bacterium]